jgi:hypothetical protein
MIALSACGGEEDDENSLTSPSTSGKGTLSFLLNGEVWRPLVQSDFPFTPFSHGMEKIITDYNSDKNKASDMLNIRIWGRHMGKNHFFYFTLDSVLYEGKFKVKQAEYKTEHNDRYNQIGFDLNSNFVILSKIHRDYKPAYVDDRNVLTWGHYTMDSYVSGTFEMTLKNKNGDSVVITNGRFDLKNQSYSNY